MASDADQEAGPRQLDGRRPAQVTTVRKAVTIGAVVALLVGGATSLATARMTDRRSDLDRQLAEITQLASQVSEQEAQITKLASQAGEGAQEVDRLNTGLYALQAENLSLKEQLSQFLNPVLGPAPTASLTVSWLQPSCSYGNFDGGAVTYGPCTQAVVCVTIENTSDSAMDIYYSYSQFSGVDGANFVYQPRLATPGYGIGLGTPLLGGQLGPGEKARGELLYDVPPPAPQTVIPAVLTRLVWNTGFGETPEIAVDLPAPQGVYNGIASTSQC